MEVLLEAQVVGVQRRWLGRGRKGEKVVELVVVVFLILPSIIYWLLVGSYAVGVHYKDLAALFQKLAPLPIVSDLLLYLGLFLCHWWWSRGWRQLMVVGGDCGVGFYVSCGGGGRHRWVWMKARDGGQQPRLSAASIHGGRRWLVSSVSCLWMIVLMASLRRKWKKRKEGSFERREVVSGNG